MCWILALLFNWSQVGKSFVILENHSLLGTVQNSILLEWQTATELDNAGFHLWRATGEGWKDGDYSTVIRLTDQLIPALGDGSSYFYIDSHVEPGVTYYYALEDIDLFGKSTIHWDFINSARVE